MDSITLKQQYRSTTNNHAISILISGACAAFVCKKLDLSAKKGFLAHVATEAIELTFIRILGNPPLAFAARIGVRAVSVIIVNLSYAITRPNRQDLKAVTFGAIAGSVCMIGIDVIKILNSEDPTQTIAHQGFALTIHNVIEAADIQRRSQLAVG